MDDITQQRLLVVAKHREQIATVLKQSAAGQTRARRKRTLALARCFAQPIKAEELLNRPDALAVSLPLLAHASKGTLQPWQIENGVHAGVDQMDRHTPTAHLQRISGKLAYPAVVLLICAMLLVAMAIFLVPEFERMFDEFGLRLPPTTAFVLLMSGLIGRWWFALLVFFALAAGAIWLTLRRERSWLTALLTSARSAWAQWAWHLAMLIEAGVSTGEAIAIAGGASHKTWLQHHSAVWADQIAGGHPPLDGATHVGGQSCQLLGYAIRLPVAADQAALLYEIATIYRNRDRGKTAWKLELLTPIAVCVVGSAVGMVVVALFMPLVDLIRGLT